MTSNMSNCLYYKISPGFDNIADDEESWFQHFNQNGFHAPKVSMETISISSKPDCPIQETAADTTSLELKDSQQRFLDACQKGDLVTGMLKTTNLIRYNDSLFPLYFDCFCDSKNEIFDFLIKNE